MPVDSTKAMPSNTSRSETRGRPGRPVTAGLRGWISGSTSAHSSSLISRGGGEDADDDMPGTLRRRLSGRQSPTTYFRNVFLGVTLAVEPQAWGGPSDWSAYECRAGCSCPFGGG